MHPASQCTPFLPRRGLPCRKLVGTWADPAPWPVTGHQTQEGWPDSSTEGATVQSRHLEAQGGNPGERHGETARCSGLCPRGGFVSSDRGSIWRVPHSLRADPVQGQEARAELASCTSGTCSRGHSPGHCHFLAETWGGHGGRVHGGPGSPGKDSQWLVPFHQ